MLHLYSSDVQGHPYIKCDPRIGSPPRSYAEINPRQVTRMTVGNPERVIVLQVDAALQDAPEYEPDELPDEIVIKGRGGTDFRPGFEWLDEQAIEPGVCLYFTDMECSSYPEAEPGFPVIWVSWRTPPPEGNSQPWGERIDIAG